MCFWHSSSPSHFRDRLSHLKLNTRPGATLKQPSVRPCQTSFSISISFFFSIVCKGEKNISEITRRKKKKPEYQPREEKCLKNKKQKQRWVLMTSFSFFPTFWCAFIQAFSTQSYNCFHVISFVSPRPWDAKVNYSLAVQVQLDDNYTTAGSRGGKQLLSMWELIRWFSSSSSFFFFWQGRGGGGQVEDWGNAGGFSLFHAA